MREHRLHVYRDKGRSEMCCVAAPSVSASNRICNGTSLVRELAHNITTSLKPTPSRSCVASTKARCLPHSHTGVCSFDKSLSIKAACARCMHRGSQNTTAHRLHLVFEHRPEGGGPPTCPCSKHTSPSCCQHVDRPSRVWTCPPLLPPHSQPRSARRHTHDWTSPCGSPPCCPLRLE